MKPDFIIAEKHTAAGSVFIVLPTNTMALTWLFARVTATERRQLSAHLDEGRYAQFKSDAAISNLTIRVPAAVLASEEVQ
jgi:hypothetical protein